jgi:serine phosphatase RsbU (regulator of sigma subunit)
LNLAVLLAAAEAAPPVAAADAVGAVLADMLGAEEVSFLIADYSGDSLIRLGHRAGRRFGPLRASQETAERVGLQGTPQGAALATQVLQVEQSKDGAWLFAPVTSRGEAVGVLELRLSDAPDEAILADVAHAAHALAYIVIANRRYTDLFEWGQRSVPLSLAAEIQHRLLPGSYTCEGGQFTLAAWLEPAGEVGGDTFDFSLDRDALHFSMTDAMGHTVNASLLATLLVGAVRNGRRAGAGIVEQAELADAALIEHARGSQFVTGQIVRVDLEAQTAEIVNAGHPPPLRLRDGVVQEVRLEADPPFGAVDEASFRLQTLDLHPGDRLMFLTDGVLERLAASVDVRANMVASGGDHPREAVQQLIRAAVKASGGHLEDDATALCFDWHGGPPRDRISDAGANAAT